MTKRMSKDCEAPFSIMDTKDGVCKDCGKLLPNRDPTRLQAMLDDLAWLVEHTDWRADRPELDQTVGPRILAIIERFDSGTQASIFASLLTMLIEKQLECMIAGNPGEIV